MLLSPEIVALLFTAASIGVIHTLVGPDHYLPIAALAKSRAWALPMTLLMTVVFGLAHTAGSVLLGVLGIALGYSLDLINLIESGRGRAAGYVLAGGGLAYLIYSVRMLRREKSHAHEHTHADGTVHSHAHSHHGRHVHLHHSAAGAPSYLLLMIFILGPCEALIPVLMYPASQQNYMAVVLVVLAFVLATLLTMLILVALTYLGVTKFSEVYIQKYAGVCFGAVLGVSGVLVLSGL